MFTFSHKNMFIINIHVLKEKDMYTPIKVSCHIEKNIHMNNNINASNNYLIYWKKKVKEKTSSSNNNNTGCPWKNRHWKILT